MAGDDGLMQAYRAIIDEARAQVAAGHDPDADALAARIHAAGQGKDQRAERRALQQLERVLTVHRARGRLARAPAPPPEASPLRRAMLRTRPMINANMDVRRQTDGETFTLAWDAAAAVTGWEVRISERPDARGDYVVRETRALPADATAVEVPLGERPLRVHLLGRGRDGRLLRRAVISALTRATWNDRWQQRASAS